MPRIKTYKKPRPFVGLLKRRASPSMARECFWSSVTPAEGRRYTAVYGPFRTTRGARWCQRFGPTALAGTVSEMEAAALAVEQLERS